MVVVIDNNNNIIALSNNVEIKENGLYIDEIYFGNHLLPITQLEIENEIDIKEYEYKNGELIKIKKDISEELSNAVQIALAPQLISMENDSVISVELFIKHWEPSQYKEDDIVTYENQVWKCYQEHNSTENPSWTPIEIPEFWVAYHAKSAKYAKPWVKPSGVHDAYNAGEMFLWEDGLIYVSKIDGNVFSPDEDQEGYDVVDKKNE